MSPPSGMASRAFIGEIEQSQFHLTGIDLDRWEGIREAHRDPHARTNVERSSADMRSDQDRQVHDLRHERLTAAEGEQTLGQGCSPLGALNRVIDQACSLLLVCRKALPEQRQEHLARRSAGC